MPLSPERAARYEAILQEYERLRQKYLASQAGGERLTDSENTWLINNASTLEALSQNREPFTTDLDHEQESDLPPALIETVRELWGGEKAWVEMKIPTLESLGLEHFLDPEYLDRLYAMSAAEATAELDKIPYVQEMFPREQSEADTAAGITRERPSWWSQEGKVDVLTKDLKTGKDIWKKETIAPTKGVAYLRSIAQELNTLQGVTILLDSARKPNYTDGTQPYGTLEQPDPLQGLFAEVFRDKPHRFSHTWDELNTQLLPALKTKILNNLKAKGITNIQETDFAVTLTPFHTDQEFMVKNSKESSGTNCYDWTSTPLLKQNGEDTGHRLLSGLSDLGGVGYVVGGLRSACDGVGGPRFAVMWQKRD
jgi:hypothetical protein